jgi:endoglucanase
MLAGSKGPISRWSSLWSTMIGVPACRSLIAVIVLCLLSGLAPERGLAGPWIGVSGNHLVDRAHRQIRLLGINRSGTEYQCEQGYGFFEGPTDNDSIKAMKSWHINAVRVPLNESCWLGINGIEQSLAGSAYQTAIRGYVDRLQAAGLYVILDLHWAAPGHRQATGIIPMADAEHAPEFWRSVATSYRDDRGVLFDLYNEPHNVGWHCWESG